MNHKLIYILGILLLLQTSCKKKELISDGVSLPEKVPFSWKSATVYFLLTDRFYNADTTNDVHFNRTKPTATLRGFEGGDLKGITQKINEGYFTDLGIDAIWINPVVEQNHGLVDEGTGATYGFHGYWIQDWTAVDPNYGIRADLKEMVAAAHAKGIRVLLDAVINHTGPVTVKDPIWKGWVREDKVCDFKDYAGNTSCDLVKNLPDIITDSNEAVELPKQLVEKWKKEGRYEQEIKELNAFFEATGYPKAPRFYIMKWLADYIEDYGIDGYRCDTVKHTEPEVWGEFKKVCDRAFSNWKSKNPEKVLDDAKFYLVGEVYHYYANNGIAYDYGDKKVDYSKHGFDALINFDLKNQRATSYQETFERYQKLFEEDFKNFGLLNYLSSHDDQQPFDMKREKSFETANKLLLTKGAAQIYYGDEIARPLIIEGTVGDATLRSNMDWSVEGNTDRKALIKHWSALGKFRRNHPAIGRGDHKTITAEPFVFSRTFEESGFSDQVIVGMNLPRGKKEIPVATIFKEGEKVLDTYSGIGVLVKGGKAIFDTPFNMVLLEKK